MSKNLYNTHCKSKLCIELNNGPEEKLENALRENSPVMKFIQNLPYVVCVDGFKNFDFLRSFLNVSVELPLS